MTTFFGREAPEKFLASCFSGVRRPVLGRGAPGENLAFLLFRGATTLFLGVCFHRRTCFFCFPGPLASKPKSRLHLWSTPYTDSDQQQPTDRQTDRPGRYAGSKSNKLYRTVRDEHPDYRARAPRDWRPLSSGTGLDSSSLSDLITVSAAVQHTPHCSELLSLIPIRAGLYVTL